jgi:hypothetical protein
MWPLGNSRVVALRVFLVAALAVLCAVALSPPASASPPRPKAQMACPPCAVVVGEVAGAAAIRAALLLAAGAGAAEAGHQLAKATDGKMRDRHYRVKGNVVAWGRYWRGVGRAFWQKYRTLRGVGARMRQKLGGPNFRNRLPKMVGGCFVGAVAGAFSGLPDTDAGHAAKRAKEGCIGGFVTKALLP